MPPSATTHRPRRSDRWSFGGMISLHPNLATLLPTVLPTFLACSALACGPSASTPGADAGTGSTGAARTDSTSRADASDASDAQDDADADTSTDDGDSTDTGPTPVCEPGATRCVDDSTLETCRDDGQQWTPMPCAAAATCVVCDDGNDCDGDRCIGPCDATGTSNGCDFIVNRLLSAREEFPDAVVITAPSTQRGTANVELFRVGPGSSDESLLEEASLEAGQTVRWILEDDVGQATSWFRTGGHYRVHSDAVVSAYHHAPGQTATSNDSSLLVPVASLGTTYVVPSYGPLGAQPQGLGVPSYFEAVLVHDGTSVSFHPPVPTAGAGAPLASVTAGGTGTFEGSAADTVRVTASTVALGIPVDERDLSGTVIESSHPIWVAGGTRCARVPVRENPAAGFCDTLQEVLVPVSEWGSTHIAAPPPPRDTENHYWRVYAGNEGPTSFVTEPNVLTDSNCSGDAELDGDVCTLDDRGAWVELEVPHGTGFVVRGVDAEIDRLMVVGYLQSRRAGGEPAEASTDIGDPSMYQLTHTDAFMREYVVAAGVGFGDEWLQVIRRVGDATVFVDGVGVAAWTSVGEYEFANVLVTASTVVVQGEDAFGLLQFGYTDPNDISRRCTAPSGSCTSSYAHSAGWSRAPRRR